MELPQSPFKAKIETEQMHTQFYTDAMFALLIKNPYFLISMSGLTQNQLSCALEHSSNDVA